MRQAFRLMIGLLMVMVAVSWSGTAWAYASAKLKREWRARGDVIWARTPERPAVALTFDDGPNPYYTTAILDELDKYGWKATFFMIGSRVERFPEIVRDVADRGHLIGAHGYAHKNMAILNHASVNRDMEQAEESFRIAGVTPRFFRPPYGTLSPTLVETMRGRGYKVVMWTWTQDSKDWARRRPEHMVRNIMKQVQPGDIILFHDGTGNRKNTLLAIRLLLKELDENGFELVTVEHLLALPEAKPSRSGPPRGP